MGNDEILINQLFAGSYLNEGANIGHEVINLFKDDNGQNYLYITPSGKVDSGHPVKSVIFVHNVEGKTTVEVIAKAESLHPIDLAPENVKYANTLISDIFSDNIYHGESDPGIFCTYRTDKIRLPKKNTRILLTINDEFKPNDDTIRLIRLHSNSKAISNQSGRKYYSALEDYDAYAELQSMLDNDSYWEDDNTTEKLIADESMRGAGPTFLEIIRKENDELTFSNLLAYYFQYNKGVFRKFAHEILGVGNIHSGFNIIRESNDNIDLWIEDDNNIFVIENKIRSGLNGIKDDGYSQLNKYQEYTEKRVSDPEDSTYGKASHYYIFTPNYNHFDISKLNLVKPYIVVTYKDIYDFFRKNAASFLEDRYFSDFLKGLKNHTMSMSELNFSIMRARFLEKINRT